MGLLDTLKERDVVTASCNFFFFIDFVEHH